MNHMIIYNPKLNPFKQRVKDHGAWDNIDGRLRSLIIHHPSHPIKNRKKVFIVERETRRFAVVSSTKCEADSQINLTIGMDYFKPSTCFAS